MATLAEQYASLIGTGYSGVSSTTYKAPTSDGSGSGSGSSGSSSGSTTPTTTVDPYAQYLAQQQAAQSAADAYAAKQDALRTQTNLQVFRQIMGSFFNLSTDSSWIDALFKSAKKYYDQGIGGDTVVELLLREENAPQQFKDRFSAYLSANAKSIAAGMAPVFSNLAEYVATERAYGDKLKSYAAFGDLATQDNIKKFIENNVSVDEVAARIDNAYYAIYTADAVLKDQIRKQFPGINDNDLARALVTGSVDSIQQKIRFGAAAIGAEAQIAGIQTVSDLQELSRQGITRDQARTAFQNIGREQVGIAQASRTFGRQVSQQALEQEAFGIQQSTEAKALRSQARAEFGGQSGVISGSLSKKKSSSQL